MGSKDNMATSLGISKIERNEDKKTLFELVNAGDTRKSTTLTKISKLDISDSRKLFMAYAFGAFVHLSQE